MFPRLDVIAVGEAGLELVSLELTLTATRNSLSGSHKALTLVAFRSKAIPSSIIFHRCTLNFRKIQTDVLIYSIVLGTSNLDILVFSIYVLANSDIL